MNRPEKRWHPGPLDAVEFVLLIGLALAIVRLGNLQAERREVETLLIQSLREALR